MLDGVRVLAVHHDGGLNGATLLFQTVLEGLARDHGAVVVTRVLRDGPIVERARALGPVHVDDVEPERRGVRRRILRRWRLRRLRSRLRPYDVVFANSAASLRAAEEMLDGEETPLVVFVHESSYLLQHVVNFSTARRVLRRADLIFAVSPDVRSILERLVAPDAPIVVVRGFIPAHATPQDPAPVAAAASDSGAQIVGAMGTMSWYKGAELFIVVAQRIRQLLPDHDVQFVWAGRHWRSDTGFQLAHDLERAGLDGVVRFVGETEDPATFLRSLAVLLLPSREDSWPLVMLEAAAEGVPIVCFRGAGGAEHFVASGGGVAVPYLDVEAMAQAVTGYLSDPELRARDAQMARELVRTPTPDEQIHLVASEIAGLVRAPLRLPRH
jgi:glycosyltransferase involved in cell wall biosynthesis